MTSAAPPVVREAQGGGFLLEESIPAKIFTPEDLTEEHRAVAKTARDFFNQEVQPNLEALDRQQHGLGPNLLRKSAELGLTSVAIPEAFGGLEMDLASSIVVAENLGRDASYSGWHGAHTSIGTLPLLYFGSQAQKKKYLPKLASAEMIAAYALTEPQAGSDAQAIRTRADLSPDGSHYILNGQKMWITNGGAADLFTVFAKVDGEKITAFLVEQSFAGFSSGAEEKKMGLKGSSTTALFLDNVHVPIENVLGEIGRGQIIAFNILNLGRLKLGVLSVAAAKNVLGLSLSYARQRKAFGSTIGEFGAIQHKLAEMAIRIYVAESAAWRVVGLIQHSQSHSRLKALEEFAIECSIVKVFGSEVLDYAADEGVQIHGGYGFHQDYAVERIYRDARVNRIFEGTNEINRLLITGMLLKRAARGQLALFDPVPVAPQDEADEELRLVQNSKRVALYLAGLAFQKHGTQLEKQQELMMHLADIVIDVFAMESALLRTRKLGSKSDIAQPMCTVFLRDAIGRIELTARGVLGACSQPDDFVRKLTAYPPVDSIALRRVIAKRLLEKGSYAV